jgi:hypothetical protein
MGALRRIFAQPVYSAAAGVDEVEHDLLADFRHEVITPNVGWARSAEARGYPDGAKKDEINRRVEGAIA